MLVLCGAVYARAGTQPRERFRTARSAPTRGARLFRSAIAGADGEFVCRSDRAQNEIFRIATGRCGCSRDPPCAVHDVPSEGFYAGYCGGHGRGTETLRPRAFAGAIGIDGSVASDGPDLHA